MTGVPTRACPKCNRRVGPVTRPPNRFTHARSIILAAIALLMNASLAAMILLNMSTGGFSPGESVTAGSFAAIATWMAVLTLWRVFLTPRDQPRNKVFNNTLAHVALAFAITILLAMLTTDDAWRIKPTPIRVLPLRTP